MATRVGGTEHVEDCELVADNGEKISACKRRLMIGSEFFDVMFSSSMMESKAREIKIREVPSELLTKIVSACTSATLILENFGQIPDLLSLSELYRMPDLKLDLLSFLSTLPMHTKRSDQLSKILESILVTTPEEKKLIATWIVNNWHWITVWDEKETRYQSVIQILEYFEHYLNLSEFEYK